MNGVVACGNCHTPMGPNGPQMNSEMAGGLEFKEQPFTAYASNLTPDPETGLGRWTARDFKATIRSGRHLGRGRTLLPPMPIPAYSQFNDRDLEAIFAYLKTVPAVKNRVPEPLPPQGQAQAQAQAK